MLANKLLGLRTWSWSNTFHLRLLNATTSRQLTDCVAIRHTTALRVSLNRMQQRDKPAILDKSSGNVIWILSQRDWLVWMNINDSKLQTLVNCFGNDVAREEQHHFVEAANAEAITVICAQKHSHSIEEFQEDSVRRIRTHLKINFPFVKTSIIWTP